MSMTLIDQRDLTTLTLDELSALSVEEVSLSATCAAAAVQHAIRCGEALLEAQSRVPPGDWVRWLESSDWPHSDTHARCFMRLAKYQSDLPPEAWQRYIDRDGNERQPTANRAFRMLRGLPPIQALGSWISPLVGPNDKAEVLRLRSMGASYTEIVAVTGLPKSTIAGWCNPAAAEQARRKRRARRREEAVARKALTAERERSSRNRLAKVTGGELSKSYAAVRQALAALDKVGGERAGEAIGHLHRAEESIVEAMREQRSSESSSTDIPAERRPNTNASDARREK
jgi:hypothetical protein